MRGLRSVNRFAEGKGTALFLIAFGSVFAIVGLQVGGLFSNGLKAIASFSSGAQIFLCLGVTPAGGGLSQLKEILRQRHRIKAGRRWKVAILMPSGGASLPPLSCADLGALKRANGCIGRAPGRWRVGRC